VLCKKKHEALVEITLPKDANIHAREYQLYLPRKEELQRKPLMATSNSPTFGQSNSSRQDR
jgi:hypothetical protein